MALIYRRIIIEDRKHLVLLSEDSLAERETEIFLWCHNNFGDIDDGYWDWEWRSSSLCFYFFKEIHAVAFKLRWI